MELVYIIPGFDSAVPSQVISLLQQYKKENKCERIVLLSPDPVPEKYSEHIEVVPYKNDIFLNSIYTFRLARRISKVLDSLSLGDEAIIHCRSELMAYTVKRATKKVPVLADFRGVTWCEYELYRPKTLSYRLFKYYKTNELLNIEGKVFKRINKVSCVSDFFKNYLNEKWGTRDDVAVIPSSAKETIFRIDLKSRKSIREELELVDDDFLFLFSSGGNSVWQNIEVIISQVKKINDPRIKILILSSHPEQLTSLEDNIVTIKKSPYEEVYRYLNAADAGSLFRDDNLVNHVASPIKTSEYLCCGLPMITNNTVYSTANFVKEHNAGIVCKSLDKIIPSDLDTLKAMNRETISQKAVSLFGLNSVSKQYLELYKQMLEQ